MALAFAGIGAPAFAMDDQSAIVVCEGRERVVSEAKWRAFNASSEVAMKIKDSIVEIRAPVGEVWRALTEPDLVKQWQYGSDLQTTWEPGTPIKFRNEWNGQVFEQSGTVLEFTPPRRLKYSLHFPRGDAPDQPADRFFMTYEISESERMTRVLFRQEDPRPSEPEAGGSEDGGPDVLAILKALVEGPNK